MNETFEALTMCNYSMPCHNDSATNTPALRAVAVMASDVAARWPSIVMSTIQWMMFVAGIVGNILVLTVLVWRRSTNQLVTQMFVGAMSVTDIGLLLTGGWVQALLYVTKTWTSGRYCCKLQNGLLIVHINTSAWTNVALAIDRCAFPAQFRCLQVHDGNEMSVFSLSVCFVN
jgi:7 transmembrane receptor (rhodopsin family)